MQEMLAKMQKEMEKQKTGVEVGEHI